MHHARIFIRSSLILLMIELSSCIWSAYNPEKEEVCNTLECQARGEEYKSNMDTDANPCQDFYTFSCGNWHNNHAGPKYASDWNVLDVMNFDIAQLIKRTLESYNFQPGGNILFHRAKQVYETCVKIPEYPKKDANNIARLIMRMRLVPKTPLWEIHSKYLKLSGESAFFRTTVVASEASEEGVPVLIVMEPSSAYGSILHDQTWTQQEKRNYIIFLFLIMKSLRLTDSDTLIKERIEKVFEFRKMLDRIIERNSKKNPDSFNPLTGSQLDMWFPTARHDQRNKHIRWAEVVEAMLQNLSSEMRRTRKVIAMRQKQYFLDLMDLFKNVSEEILAYHVEIYFVERHLKFQEDMYKLLEATSVEPHSRFRYIREKYYPRWQKCIESHNMQETLEKLLFYKWFPKEYPDTIHQLIGKIKIAIENQMKRSTWLDQPTRNKTLVKLNKVEEWIGFPPWINGTGPPKERDKKEILTPNADLNINDNVLYVHMPLLLPPMFSPNIPAVYNYAGIGTSLGHELYHVIDDCGSYLEGENEIVWWPVDIRTKCMNKKLLFIKEFNNITNREFKNRYNIEVKSDTSGTFLEDYPDVMGLEAAYNAYKELASKEKPVCGALPHFEKYSCDQMFYIAFANTYCGRYSKKSEVNKLQTWEHSVDSVRINGAVAQMESFGTAFGCPVGSTMNPQEKLNMWQ